MGNEREFMDVKIEKADTGNIITIPNALSFMRILLITPFMILFLNREYVWAAIMVVISGLSDCVDGFIARKLNQISDFGKVLDPIADKLTLLAVGVAICITVPEVIPIVSILVLKDLLMLIGGFVLLRHNIRPPMAKWYGKLGTILFYLSASVIVVLKIANFDIPYLSFILLSVTAAAMIFALVKYFLLFIELMGNNKKGA